MDITFVISLASDIIILIVGIALIVIRKKGERNE